MQLLDLFKRFFGRASDPSSAEMRCVVLLQREAHRFSGVELQAAAERGWSKAFDGQEDAMYFVSADHTFLDVVKAGPHVIRITSVHERYAQDDEYALSQLPQPEQRKAWNEHHACTFLELFNDLESRSIPDKEAYSSLARLALQLGDANCTAVFMPIKNIMMPNDGAAEQGLWFLINKELPLP